MSYLYRLYCRIFHFGLKLFALFFPIPKPTLYEGKTGLDAWFGSIKQQNINKLLIVTDKVLYDLGILTPYINALNERGIETVLFTDVQPNPTIKNVEDGVVSYNENNCNGILTIGGGSPIDCAKLIGARIVKPNKSVRKFKGLFRVLKKLPPLYAIPTTAGTGSETTLAAVISDPDVKEKYAVTDVVLMPRGAILLPDLTVGLPPHITAATGMDALTHAVESYIGINGTKFTNNRALEACKLVFSNLPTAYENGTNIVARAAMLKGAFYAGEAFTRVAVGYVHAIAHQLGALYGTPHGLANAILLPKILRWYGESAHNKLADIADACGFDTDGKSTAEKAESVIAKIEQYNASMAIPEVVDSLQNSDVLTIVNQAMDEAHPMYPVPRFMTHSDCEKVVRSLLPA